VTIFCLVAMFAWSAGIAVAQPSETASGDAAGVSVGGGTALAEQLSPWFAAMIGGVGSAAYLTAVWVGLVGRSEGRDRVLAHFRKLWGLKIPLYLTGGGCVAMVFQLPEAKLVPVQAFIIGCTWPAVVSNYLSGRQSGEGEEKALETLQKRQDDERLRSLVVAAPEARTPSPAIAAELDRLLEDLSQPGGAGENVAGKGAPSSGG
jgi:hypothetical protein